MGNVTFVGLPELTPMIGAGPSYPTMHRQCLAYKEAGAQTTDSTGFGMLML